MSIELQEQTLSGKQDPDSEFQSATANSSRQSFAFVKAYWLQMLGVSALELIPCFWHRRIEGCDLPSHVYNAWLAQLIAQGHAPGLWIATQWTNVLFDWLLSGLGSIFGLYAAEKIAVSICVLIFFWGAFALASVAGKRPAWFTIPCIAIVSYGWTFEMGFLNYYLSLGLSFCALAVFWRATGRTRWIAAAFLPFIYMAHPLGVLWLVFAAVFIGIVEVAPQSFRLALPFVSAGLLYAFSEFIKYRYAGSRPTGVSFFNGADQLVLFGARYYIPELGLLCFCIFCIMSDVSHRWRERGLWENYAVPLQLYALATLGAMLLPDTIYSPRYAVSVTYLLPRLTSISAVMICCLLTVMRPRKWHIAGLAAIAALFFTFLYQDTGALNRMEAEVEQMVHQLPQGQRVLATLSPSLTSRILIHHVADRACIGWCYSYGNYEPSSRQFRIRAMPGNPIVMADAKATDQATIGDYSVQRADLPVYQISECGPDITDLCLWKLEAGEKNGIGPHRLPVLYRAGETQNKSEKTSRARYTN